MNVEKHIAHWKSGALEALDFAIETVERGRVQFGLFFAHLALEKALKANVTKVTKAQPPYIHNLVRLAEIANIALSKEDVEFYEEMTGWNIAGRYADRIPKPPTTDKVTRLIANTKLKVEWLISQL
ncbi:MAG: HEPN domain-containing protein [Calditrichaeota bacterium]|nr:HEPN domain-containing protein [Calditrichota bacterium]